MKNIVLKPVITEKAMNEATHGRYAFAVLKEANKPEIARAIEDMFKVNVVKVQTITVHGKMKRAAKSRTYVKGEDWKKAVVSLKDGQKIELFDVTEGK